MSEVDKIQIQTISTCNANCVFCPYVESWHKDNPGRMELSLYKKLLIDMEELPKLKTLCPYFENEPTTDKRIFDWILMFYDKFPDKTVELSMNASNLTPTMNDKIIKTLRDKEHSVLVSFHGINEGTYEYIMNLNWNQSLSGVIDLIKRSNGILNITVRGAGTSLNNNIIYFTGGHYLSFWNDIASSYGLNTDTFKVQAFSFHDRAGDISRKERSAYLNSYGVIRNIGNEYPKFYCLRFDKVFHVLWNGDIAPCCMDYKKNISFLGNISNMSIMDYYNSDQYKRWIDIASGVVDTPEPIICEKCISPGG